MTAMLFDLHGVLLRHPTEEDQRHLEQALEVSDTQGFRRTLQEMARALDAGELSENHWWHTVSAYADNSDIDAREAFEAACAGYLNPDPDAVAAALELIDAGHRCGVLANVSIGLAVRMRRDLPWLADFDAVAFSCDIALPATAPESFSVAAEAMGAPLREVVYVSANPGHVAAAESAGLQGLLYDGPHSLRRLLPGD